MNLAERQDRWAAFQDRWAACKTVTLKRFDATKGYPGQLFLGRDIQTILRAAREAGEPMVLILEDDASMAGDFDARFGPLLEWLRGNMDRWDLFYGGWSHVVPVGHVDTGVERLVKLAGVHTSHFVIYNASMYQRMIEGWDLRDESVNIHTSWDPITIDMVLDGLSPSSTKKLACFPMLSRQINDFSTLRNEVVNVDEYFETATEVLRAFLSALPSEHLQPSLPASSSVPFQPLVAAADSLVEGQSSGMPGGPMMKTSGGAGGRVIAGPIRVMPEDLVCEFTMGGRVEVVDWFFDSRGEVHSDYSQKQIDFFLQEAALCKSHTYPNSDPWVHQAVAKYCPGKSVLVIGSVKPWYECMALRYGSQRPCHIVEYNPPKCPSPLLNYMSIAEFNRETRGGKRYDVVLSISFIEHNGLGRYGDPLDPNGDLKDMEAAKSYLADDGVMILAVPFGRDMLVWNAHRVYGHLRLPLLLIGTSAATGRWEVVEAFGVQSNWMADPVMLNDNRGGADFQPVLILKKETPQAE